MKLKTIHISIRIPKSSLDQNNLIHNLNMIEMSISFSMLKTQTQQIEHHLEINLLISRQRCKLIQMVKHIKEIWHNSLERIMMLNLKAAFLKIIKLLSLVTQRKLKMLNTQLLRMTKIIKPILILIVASIRKTPLHFLEMPMKCKN